MNVKGAREDIFLEFSDAAMVLTSYRWFAPLILAATVFIIRRRLMSSQRRHQQVPRTLQKLSEAAQARSIDLTLLGHALVNNLVAAGVCPQKSGLARIWQEHIVPRAVPKHGGWELGMTAAITGLTSAAGAKFNGRIGRIAERNADGTWQLLVIGPEGVGTANLKTRNLAAARDIDAVITAWRDIPNRSQVPHAATNDHSSQLAQQALQAVAQSDVGKLRGAIRAGADLSAKDKLGRTALHVALDMLEENTGQLESSEDASPAADDIQMIRELLAASDTSHVNAQDRQQRTPLFTAIRDGLHGAAQLLLAAGADPRLPDARGNQCLHEATVKGDMEALRLLLEDGGQQRAAADLNSRGHGGWTALGLAARSGNLAAAKALLAHGADPALVAFQGKTPLDIARANNRGAMAELLSGGGETPRGRDQT